MRSRDYADVHAQIDAVVLVIEERTHESVSDRRADNGSRNRTIAIGRT